MSAHRYTDCRIDCDHPGCGKCEFAGHFTVEATTAAEARRALKRAGWTVGVKSDDGERKDFCPAHKPAETAPVAGED